MGSVIYIFRAWPQSGDWWENRSSCYRGWTAAAAWTTCCRWLVMNMVMVIVKHFCFADPPVWLGL